jgi:hypothetical protein
MFPQPARTDAEKKNAVSNPMAEALEMQQKNALSNARMPRFFRLRHALLEVGHSAHDLEHETARR